MILKWRLQPGSSGNAADVWINEIHCFLLCLISGMECAATAPNFTIEKG
jgi:hypothetical protein